MNGENLLSAFSFVAEELIQEAEQKKIKIKGKHSAVLLFLPMAASLAVILAAVSLWTGRQEIHPDIPPESPSDKQEIPTASYADSSVDKTEYTLHFNKTDIQIASNYWIKGHFWEELSAEQADILLPLLSEKYQISGIVHYSHDEGQTTVFSIDAAVGIDGEQEAKITMAPNEVPKCYILEGDPVLSEIEGIPVEAGIFTATNNGKVIYYADFKLEDVAYYVEYAGESREEALFTDIVADIILGGKADLSILQPVVPRLREDHLTEEQAFAETDFGSYLPDIADGYQFNDALRFINQESDYLFASWSHGFDDITVRISCLGEADKKRIVSPDDTRLYDMSLYPIPWVDSIPRDIAEIVENPVFKREELTQDMIRMRGYVRDEKGDTNSVNSRFGVLYGDIVVEVSTEGVSAEKLYERLSALQR